MHAFIVPRIVPRVVPRARICLAALHAYVRARRMCRRARWELAAG
jgi:hypothetical protein